MWLAKFKVWHEGSLILDLSKGLDVVASGFYLSGFTENGEPSISRIMVARGADSQKYIEKVRNHEKRLNVYRIEGNLVFYKLKNPCDSYHTMVLDKDFFLVGPWIIKNGFEYWTIAFWKKSDVRRLYENVRKTKVKARIRLLSLKEEDVNLFVSQALESLSEKQLDAFRTALDAGYYECPRKISLKKLAKQKSMALSTFRHRLRKAESKAIPPLAFQFGAR